MSILQRCILCLLLTGCKSPEARYPVTHSSGSYISESVERNRELNAREEEMIASIIEADTAHTYFASSNGFWYYYNSRSQDSANTTTPEFGDLVEFDYSITTITGEPIYKEGELPTREYAMDQEQLFSGLREGLKLMKEGETLTFLFPSHKAFGYYGDKKKIGTNIPIKVRVTLNNIKEEPNNETNK